MSTSSKIPATDRSAGGPGSSHANKDKPHDADVKGARHQDTHVEKKHPASDRYWSPLWERWMVSDRMQWHIAKVRFTLAFSQGRPCC